MHTHPHSCLMPMNALPPCKCNVMCNCNTNVMSNMYECHMNHLTTYLHIPWQFISKAYNYHNSSQCQYINKHISTYQQQCPNMLSHNLMQLTHFISHRHFIKHLQGTKSCNHIKCPNSSHNSRNHIKWIYIPNYPNFQEITS